jgi:NADH dehydrogenase FAD-containing subunit
MSDKKNDDRKNIVVVGGGSGALAARDISAKLDASKYNLILINPRPYRILLPATARLTTSDTDHLEDTAFVPFDKTFHNGKGTFLLGKVVAIEAQKKGGSVVLESGEKVPYEVLVLAPGAVWGGPLAFPDDSEKVTSFLHEGRSRLKNANDIVLVGGGAVGIGR